jgi:hypothetical protein
MTLCHRLSQLEEQRQDGEEAASLAAAYCTISARQIVGLDRELLGGDGILREEKVGRFVADAEAIYSYEGTHEIKALIVGRALGLEEMLWICRGSDVGCTDRTRPEAAFLSAIGGMTVMRCHVVRFVERTCEAR